MGNLKPICSSINVDAVYINDISQDETKKLFLSNADIDTYQFSISIYTKDSKRVKIFFLSLEDVYDFIKAYGLK